MLHHVSKNIPLFLWRKLELKLPPLPKSVAGITRLMLAATFLGEPGARFTKDLKMILGSS